MEELGKALAEAIRAGSAFAPSAVFGYYLVRAFEAFIFPLGVFGVAMTAGYTIRTCVLRYADVEDAKHRGEEARASEEARYRQSMQSKVAAGTSSR